MAFEIKDIDESQAPLLDHLMELRTRLMRCIVALAIAFGVCFYFVKPIFAFLVAPLAEAFPGGNGRLVYTKLYEAFFVELKVALFAAFILSFPVLANQLWAFVAPGLYAKEKRAFFPSSSPRPSCSWRARLWPITWSCPMPSAGCWPSAGRSAGSSSKRCPRPAITSAS
jgi:Sec-independent protein secretion pathway component TatC